MQPRRSKFTKESDIYSLGLVLYEILLYSTQRDDEFKEMFQEYVQEAPFVDPVDFQRKYGRTDSLVNPKVKAFKKVSMSSCNKFPSTFLLHCAIVSCLINVDIVQ